MNPLAGLIAPVLALLPVLAVDAGPDERAAADQARAPEAMLAQADPAIVPAADAALRSFADLARALREADAANQVRIEQRVIIRIAPGPMSRGVGDMRRSLFAPFGFGASAPHVEERRVAQCTPVAGIAGVQPDGASRLILYMRDQRILSATLEKGCNAREYYSGFLVERTGDGMICAGRDKLQARSGTTCAVGRLRQLVMVDDED